MGWRYYCFTTGGLSLLFWAVRFTMPLMESPRYLVGRGMDDEAVKVVHELARINGKTSNLTVEQLLVVGGKNWEDRKGGFQYVLAAVRHLKGLFETKRMALSSALIFLINCTCAVLSPLWYNDAFAVLVGIGVALYFVFLPYM